MKPKYAVVDVETTGLSWHKDRMHGIGLLFDYEERGTYYRPSDVPPHIKEWLLDPSILKVGHNLHGFDAKFCRKAGLELGGEFDDTMVIWNLVDPSTPLDLKWLTEYALGRPENLERKRTLDRRLSQLKMKHVGQLCALDLKNFPPLPPGSSTPAEMYSSKPTSDDFTLIASYCLEDIANTRDLYEEGMKRLAHIASLQPPGPNVLTYYFEEARPLERVLFEMEWTGIRVDLEALARLKRKAVKEIERCEARMRKIGATKIALVEQRLWEDKIQTLKTEKGQSKHKKGIGKLRFSFSNTNHMAALLYGHCGIEPRYTRKGGLQLDKAAVDDISAAVDPATPLGKFLGLYAESRKWGKLLTTYTGDDTRGILSKVEFDAQGNPRIHTTYRQTTETGRLTSSGPNMQNIPADSVVKSFFIPDDPATEVIDDADYSQIELRVAADESGDEKLIRAYVEGKDVHLLTASILYGRLINKSENIERQAGKRTNFLTIYKGSAWRLQQSLLQDTGKEFDLETCERFIEKWFAEYAGVRDYLDRQTKKFFQTHTVQSSAGRIRYLGDLRFAKGLGDDGLWWDDSHEALTRDLVREWKKRNPKERHREPANWEKKVFAKKCVSHALKAGYNQPIQSKAASLTKRAMIELHRRGFRILNQVHDSIAICRKKTDPQAKEELISVMENIAALRVPLVADCKTLLTLSPKTPAK